MTQPPSFSASQQNDPATSAADPDVPATSAADPDVYAADDTYTSGETYDAPPTFVAPEADDTGDSKSDAAKEQAGQMKDSAAQSGQKVAGTAKEQAGEVASEAGTQAKQLIQTGLSEAGSQVSAQQQRLAGGVQSLADELDSIASKSEKSGPITDLAQQASSKGSELARKLENSDPSDLLEDVKAFARRRPVAFLGIAALAGLVVGRLTRGLAADAKSSSEGTGDYSSNYGGDPAPVGSQYSSYERTDDIR